MKRALFDTEYSFAAATRQITLVGLGDAKLERLYAIDNITRGTIYYLAGRPDFAPEAAGTIITLNNLVDVSGHLDTDELHILYEVAEPLPTGAATEALQTAGNASLASILAKIIAAPATEATAELMRLLLVTLASVVRAEDSPHTSGDPGFFILGQRADTDGPTTGLDGDYTALKLDEQGRLKTASQPAASPLVTGSITASAQTVSCNSGRASNIIAHMVASSLVGHNATFEGSIDSTDGLNGAWFAIDAKRTNANTVELVTGVLAATPAYGWELSVNGFNWIRVRATAHTSGTALWKFQPAPFATEPIPAIQVHPVTGSGNFNSLLQAGTAVAGAFLSALSATTNGAANTSKYVSAASNNLTSVVAAAAALASIAASNNSATQMVYLKLYNKASAPVLASDVPVDIIAIPPRGSVFVPYAIYPRFSTGLAFALVGGDTGSADTDTTIVSANQVTVTFRRA
jgi:hypothetical protein